MKKLLSLIFLFAVFSLHAEDRNLLQNAITKAQLQQCLAKGTDWVYFPAYTHRAAWEQLPTEVRQEAIAEGEKALEFQWDIVKATAYIEYTRSGNRNIMQHPASAREKALQDLALAELIEGKGRFTDALIDGVWAVCEQSTWVLSAHLPNLKEGAGLPNPNNTIIDLGSGRTGALLAWIHYYFAPSFDKVSPYIADRIRTEIDTRILQPYYTRTDMWWMGFGGGMVNNWNVWVNYNVIQCVMLIEKDNSKRVDNIYKAMQSVDKFINYYHDDGGCEEGPTYWGHAGGKFFECLELLHAISGKKIDIYQNPLVKNIGTYIYKAYIDDPYFVNFADASAKGSIYPGLVYRYGKAINDPTMQGFGTLYAQKDKMDHTIPSGTLETVIHDLFDAKAIVADKAIEPYIADCWLPGTEIAVARNKANTNTGFYFAAKGGYNNESHNHNDVGTFVLYYNSRPAIIDVGVGTYTRQTFSADRYKIWTMQSGYHNLPLINGTEQAFGKQYRSKNISFKESAKAVNLQLDLVDAYPADAGIQSWVRSYQLNRGKNFTITDTYSLSEKKGTTALHFMTSCVVDPSIPGKLILTGDGFQLQLLYNAQKLTAEIDQVPIDDKRLQAPWGDELRRIRLTFKDSGLKGSNKIEINKL